MTKQAKKAVAEAQKQQNQFKAQEMDLQMRFSKMSHAQRQVVANYLNSYNLAAWIYNEVLDEDCRIYIDLAMNFTIETQKLANSMRDLSDDQNEVEKLVNDINHGE